MNVSDDTGSPGGPGVPMGLVSKLAATEFL